MTNEDRPTIVEYIEAMVKAVAIYKDEDGFRAECLICGAGSYTSYKSLKYDPFSHSISLSEINHRPSCLVERSHKIIQSNSYKLLK